MWHANCSPLFFIASSLPVSSLALHIFSFTHSFIHSFIQHLLNTCDTVSGAISSGYMERLIRPDLALNWFAQSKPVTQKHDCRTAWDWPGHLGSLCRCHGVGEGHFLCVSHVIITNSRDVALNRVNGWLCTEGLFALDEKGQLLGGRSLNERGRLPGLARGWREDSFPQLSQWEDIGKHWQKARHTGERLYILVSCLSFLYPSFSSLYSLLVNVYIYILLICYVL